MTVGLATDMVAVDDDKASVDSRVTAMSTLGDTNVRSVVGDESETVTVPGTSVPVEPVPATACRMRATPALPTSPVVEPLPVPMCRVHVGDPLPVVEGTVVEPAPVAVCPVRLGAPLPVVPGSAVAPTPAAV